MSDANVDDRLPQVMTRHIKISQIHQIQIQMQTEI